MDQFLSTYKKDYVWPSTRIRHTPNLLRENESCMCKDSSSRELKVVNLCGDSQDWSRMGPMGRLLDPKLYPAKTGPSPESDETKFNQPNSYLEKLEEKYPNLYGILQSAPVDEIIKRVDEDRLKTTYQVDYSDTAARNMINVPAPSDSADQPPDQDDCPTSNRAQLSKSQRDKDREKKTKSLKKEEDELQKSRIPPWRSEYQDNICRVGDAIMKSKMHHRKKQGPAWAMNIL